VAPEAPAELRAVVERTMARDAAERPDAAEVASMLRDPSGADRTRVMPVPAAPGAIAASSRTPARSPAGRAAPNRTVAWALAALLAVTLVSALAAALFATPDAPRTPVGSHPRAVTSTAPSFAPSPSPPTTRHRGDDGHGHDGAHEPNGKALGHDGDD
jgi:hypothetical protein